MRERRQQIDFGDGQRGMADALGLGGDGGAKFGENAPLDVDDLVLGVEDLSFVFLQLRRGETLGVDEGLLALVISGSEMQVGLRNFDVIAEDGIELYLERSDAGALAFAFFDLSHVLLAVARE